MQIQYVACISFACLALGGVYGYRIGQIQLEKKYYKQQLEWIAKEQSMANKITKQNNYILELNNQLAQKQRLKTQTIIKEITRYVKDPNINVNIPTYWVFGVFNPAISNTSMPSNTDIAKSVRAIPTTTIDTIATTIVYNIGLLHKCIADRQALIDQIKNNMEEE